MSKATRKTTGRIYVITGKEKPGVNAACEELLNELIEKSQRTTCLYEPKIDQVTLSEVLDELRTLPFLSDKRYVLLKDADRFVSEHRGRLEAYFDHPSPTGVLILTVSSWPSNTKLAKKLPKAGSLIKVTELKTAQIPNRLIRYSDQARNKQLTRDAAWLLVELVGDDLEMLYNEIDKLALYVDTQKKIETRDVEALCSHNRVFNIFKVIDEATNSNLSAALETLRKVFDTDKSAHYTIIGAFAYHMRRMFSAKVLSQRKMPRDVIAKKLHIWSRKDIFFDKLSQLSLKQLADSIEQLAYLDYQIKTGQIKPQAAAEKFVLRLI